MMPPCSGSKGEQYEQEGHVLVIRVNWIIGGKGMGLERSSNPIFAWEREKTN